MTTSVDSFLTRRLVAERLRASDYGTLCRLHQDSTVMETLGGVRSDEVTSVFVRDKLEHWDRYGHGLWMFRDREDRRFIGRGLLEHIEVGGSEEVEVGYTVGAEDWGKGFASEMAGAIVAVAFHTLAVESIVSFTYPDNYASRRVMEKAGFTFEREIEHVGKAHVLYRLMRSDYEWELDVRLVDGLLLID